MLSPSPAPARALPRAQAGSALELRDVSFGYTAGPARPREREPAVEHGEFVAIAGPNGGGKTTLLRLALGLEQPNSGTARLLGDPRIAAGAAQRSATWLSARNSAARRRRPFARSSQPDGWPGVGCSEPFDALIVSSSTTPSRGSASRIARRSPLRALSGGMQQRAFIAKALAAEPSLLVLDEPTTGVDAESQESLAALLDELHRELGVTILYVSHEFGAVERFVQRLVLVRGGIVFDGAPEELPGVWHDPSHRHA